MAVTGLAKDLADRKGSSRVGLLSLLIGDSSAVGYGSEAADVHTWPSGAATTLGGAYVWNKWTNGTRDTDADSGTDFAAIDRTQGSTTDDVGLEYSLAYGIQTRYGIEDRPDNQRPDLFVVKYGLEDTRCTLDGTAGTSWSPFATAGLFARFRDYYIDPAIAELTAREDIDTVELDGLYISLGTADAASTTAGVHESFEANLPSLIERIFDHLGVDAAQSRTGLLIPPRHSLASYRGIDIVRESCGRIIQASDAVYGIDATGLERWGYGPSTTRLVTELTGQGIVDAGSMLASAIDVSGHQLWSV